MRQKPSAAFINIFWWLRETAGPGSFASAFASAKNSSAIYLLNVLVGIALDTSFSPATNPSANMNDTTTPTTAIPISNAGAPSQNDPSAQVQIDGVNGLLDETPLFSSSLISLEVSSSLPEGYSIRPLRRSDYHGGELVNAPMRRKITHSLLLNPNSLQLMLIFG
jgi:hypothetical protein